MKIKKVFEVIMKDTSREFIFAYSKGQAKRIAEKKFCNRSIISVTKVEIYNE